MLKIDSIIDPNKALQKPSTLKPGVICPANKSIRALITKPNKPKVSMLIGREIK